MYTDLFDVHFYRTADYRVSLFSLKIYIAWKLGIFLSGYRRQLSRTSRLVLYGLCVILDSGKIIIVDETCYDHSWFTMKYFAKKGREFNLVFKKLKKKKNEIAYV